MRASSFLLIALSICGAAARGFAQASAPSKSKPPAAVSTPAPAPSAPAAAPAAPSPAAEPTIPPPSAPPSASEPAGAPPASAAPTQPAPPAPAQPPGQTPPPPSYGPPPGEPPPAPYYPPLGGRPEPEIQKGDWDPWEHPTAEAHFHEGFYLRLAIGLGGGTLWGTNHALPDVKRLTLTGLGFGTSIAVGGSIAPNVILNADLFQATMFNPKVRADGHNLGSASDLSRDLGVGEDVSVEGLGIGLTYYIMPANVYLAGSVGFGQAVFQDFNGDRKGYDFGLGANIMVGKEWWVASDWGVGVAGQFVLLAAHDDVLGPLGATIFNVMFSATYN